MELKPGGANIAVTHENVVEYIYLFVEARMFGNHLKCLEVSLVIFFICVSFSHMFFMAKQMGLIAIFFHYSVFQAIKQGVYDVIPLGSLANMTAEDLRLLLCGTQEVFFL